MTESTGTARRSRRKLRWWPATIVLALLVLALGWIWLSPDDIRQTRVLNSFMAIILATLLLLLWWLALSRAPWRWRLGGLAALVLAGFLATQLVSIRGVTGDMVPVLEFHWPFGGEGTLRTSGAAPSSLPGAADYPQFQGPERDATLEGPTLARDWGARPPRELWRRPVGDGWSAFAVAGDWAVTQEQRGDQERVVAYHLATGEERWHHGDPERYDNTVAGVGPRATPTIHDGRVYTLGSLGRLNALDLETGEALWSRDVAADADAGEPDWGRSASPLVLDGRVIVPAGGANGQSLLAYDAATGEPVWAGGDDGVGYASAQLVTLAGLPQIVSFNKSSVTAHHPDDGRVLWSYPWSRAQPNVSQPVPLPGNRLLVSSGYGVGAEMLRVTGTSYDDLAVESLWRSPRLKAKFTNVVHHEGRIYGLDDGVLVCLDPETGERCWKRGRYGHGQVILVGNLLLIQAEDGSVVLVEPHPEELRELTSFEPLSSKTWNPPTLAGRYLLVRNDQEAAAYELPLAEDTGS